MRINIGITGSRHYKHLNNIGDVIDWLINKLAYAELKFVSGGAYGVDTQARIECSKRRLLFEEIKPDFSNGYDVSKYFERNDLIVNKVSILVAFWDGSSHGTSYTFSRAGRLGKTVLVILDKPVNTEMLEL
jgi:hypothetical protein